MKHAFVGAAESPAYEGALIRPAVQVALDRMGTPLDELIHRGDRVLLKPHLRHGTNIDPTSRLVSHPLFIQAVIEAILDCGGKVAIGDEGSKSLADYVARDSKHRLRKIVRTSEATLVNFAVAGGRPIRSGVPFPRYYLMTRAALDADVIVNCGNCQPHPRLTFSGAIKNTFNLLIGQTQEHLYSLFPRAHDLAHVIADVCRVARPAVSLLDLTTVRVPDSPKSPIKIGVVLASRDPVAIDSVAAAAIGYDEAKIWTTHHGKLLGLGCSELSHISISGLDIAAFPLQRVPLPQVQEPEQENWRARTSRLVRKTILRARPVIDQSKCIGCGDCLVFCPVHAIQAHQGNFSIRLKDCADCHVCIAACQSDAVHLEHLGFARTLRRLTGKATEGEGEESS